ncbi:MAG TPA: hypothetical protein VMW47_08970 [Verrucomicrobiae bacterium]|nr:hypothetical protein [Verrucomicrobiae bacterium]
MFSGPVAVTWSIIAPAIQRVSGPASTGSEVPAHAAESLADPASEWATLAAAVCSSGDPDEAVEGRVRRPHHAEEPRDRLV